MSNDLADLIQRAIDAKKGDKEFALFYLPDQRLDRRWEAALGNTCQFAMLGEAAGEFDGEGSTPEEAVTAMIRAMEAKA